MRKLFAALTLLFAVLAHGSDTTVTGTPRLPGHGVAAGYTLTLYNPYIAHDTTTNQLVVPSLIKTRLDSTGSIPTFPSVHVPDVATLAPGNTYYIATLTDVFGNTTTLGNFVITGATFDLGAAVPTPISPPNFWVGLNAQQIKGKNVLTPSVTFSYMRYNGLDIDWQTLPTVDIRDLASGFDCTGVAVSNTAMATAATQFDGKHVVIPENCKLRVTATTVVQGATGFWLDGMSQGQAGSYGVSGTEIAGCGPGTGPILQFSSSSFFRVSNLSIKTTGDTCSPASFTEGIRIDDTGSGVSVESIQLDNIAVAPSYSGGNPAVPDNWHGIRINISAKGDNIHINEPKIANGSKTTAGTGGDGIYITCGTCDNLTILNPRFTNLRDGIVTSQYFYGSHIWATGTASYTLFNVAAEIAPNNIHAIVRFTGSGSAIIENSLVSENTGPLFYAPSINVNSPCRFTSNQIGGGAYSPTASSIDLGSGLGGACTFIGNTFNINGSTTSGCAIGANYTTWNGVGVPGIFINESGNTVTTDATARYSPTCRKGGLLPQYAGLLGGWHVGGNFISGTYTTSDAELNTDLQLFAPLPNRGGGYEGMRSPSISLRSFRNNGTADTWDILSVAQGTGSSTLVLASPQTTPQVALPKMAGRSETVALSTVDPIDSITNFGASGAATWTYKIAGIGAGECHSAASATTSIVNGPATLTTANKLTFLKSVTEPGFGKYAIYRTVSGGVPATLGLIDIITIKPNINGQIIYYDDGKAGDGSTPPATSTCDGTVQGEKILVNGAGATGKAACIKADKTIGYCSDQPSVTGDCTCN